MGAEILFGLMRLRGSVPDPSVIFGMEGDLRRAAVAASALRWTSSASSAGFMLVVGESGDSRPPGLIGIVATEGEVGDIACLGWRSESERFGVCNGLMGDRVG